MKLTEFRIQRRKAMDRVHLDVMSPPVKFSGNLMVLFDSVGMFVKGFLRCLVRCRGPLGGKQVALALFSKVDSTDCLIGEC
jgi:hypothetical protein